MCVSYPPFGMSIAENSPEQQSFFSSYSSDKAHLELKQVINGYSEYKVNFTIKSKDKVFEMLRSRADSEQHVSEESLNGLLNADVLKAVKEQIQPIQKNGQNYYHLNDLLWFRPRAHTRPLYWTIVLLICCEDDNYLLIYFEKYC